MFGKFYKKKSNNQDYEEGTLIEYVLTEGKVDKESDPILY